MSYIWDDVDNDGDDISEMGSISTFATNPRFRSVENDEKSVKSNKSKSGGPSGTASYVWDMDVRVDETEKSTFSTKTFVNRESENGSLSTAGNASFGTVVNELKVKVDGLREELEKKLATAKELNLELTRITAAKERRLEKFRNQWLSKLTENQSEHSEKLKELAVKNEYLSSELKQLNKKTEALRERCALFPELQKEALDKANNEASKKQQRAYRQWQADEKNTFEKILSSKIETLKKQAADSFVPKLDALVMNNKTLVRSTIDDNEIKLLQLRRDLQLDNDNKLIETREKLQSQCRNDRDKAARQSDVKLEECRRRTSEETEIIRNKYNKKRADLEHQMDRLRKDENNKLTEMIAELRKVASKEESDLLLRQENTLIAEQQRLSSALTSHMKHIAEQQQQQQQQVERQRKQQQQEILQQKRESQRNKINKETERVIARLQEETEIERKHKERSFADLLEQARSSSQSQLQELQSNVNRASESAAKLRNEVAKLSKVYNAGVEERQRQLSEIATATPAIASLRQELHAVEKAVEESEVTRNQLMDKHREALEREVIYRCEEEIVLEQQLDEANNASKNKKQQLILQQQDELARVRSKIALLLQKKQAQIINYQELLTEKQQQSKDLEDVLNNVRDGKYGE